METLNQEGEKRGLVWKTLQQVNVADDEAKAGLETSEVADFLRSVKDFPHVKVLGLMTIGALYAGPDETRGFSVS